jgi:hypothetical protein
MENLDEFTRFKKAMGGRIEYQTGGRATTADYAAALAKVGAGTQAQKNKSLTEYAQNKAAEDIRNAIKSGGQQGLQSFVQGQLGSGIVPGLKGITSPQSGIANFARQNLINALAKNYTSQQSGYTYSPGTFVQSGGGGVFGQVAGLAAGEGVVGQVKDNSGNMAYGVRLFGKYYPSEEAAIKDLGIEKYNTVMADGGRVTKADGGSVDLTIVRMPDITELGVESLFKTR